MQEKSFGQSASCKVLVYGWYNKNNIGDDLFCHAFKKIFPYLNFEFTDNLNIDNLKEVSTVFIGGGSFLFADPSLSEECLKLIKTKTILYIVNGTKVAGAVIRGDREINEVKLKNALGANEIRLATPEEILEKTGAPVGFAGC